jgi:hypothetical protein
VAKNDEDEVVVSNAFERHAQTALVLVLVALLLWVGNTTQNTAVSVAEMRVEVAYLKALSELPPPQFLELSKRMDDQRNRIDYLEARLDQLLEREDGKR